MTLRLTRTSRCAALLAATIAGRRLRVRRPDQPHVRLADPGVGRARTMVPSRSPWPTRSTVAHVVPDRLHDVHRPRHRAGRILGDGPVRLVASGDAVAGARPAAIDDAFHIGSMTKLFTAALIMQLDQEGALSLDGTIDTWFPAAPNGSKITVQMLLEHESGLNELDFDLVGTATSQQLIDNVFTRPPIAEPGTEYQYLNAGYLILGRIAEKATGMPYADLVQARFIDPLDLKSTYLDGHGDGPEAVNGYDLACAGATGTDCLGKPSTAQAVDTSPQWKGAWSAGGMVSTGRDQAIWLRALVAGDIMEANLASCCYICNGYGSGWSCSSTTFAMRLNVSSTCSFVTMP